MKNIAYIISDINKAVLFESTLKGLKDRGFKINIILLNNGDSEMEQFSKNLNFSTHRISIDSKVKLILSIFKIFLLLLRNRIEIVHTHLFYASIVGQIAAWCARVPIRVNTRHHSMFHHIKYPRTVYVDRLVSALCTEVIAPSVVVKNILVEKEFVSPSKVHLIYHGFELEKFSDVNTINNDTLKSKYNPEHKYPVIGIISRYIYIKGIEYSIEAFKKYLTKYPNALLILANANGDYSDVIKSKLRELPTSSYCEIEFENDIHSLYHNFNIFLHVPIDKDREAFGQTYVEALAAGIPSVFTLSGIANEFLVDERNCLVVSYKDSQSILDACIRLSTQTELRESVIAKGKEDVNALFSLTFMLDKLSKLYLKQ